MGFANALEKHIEDYNRVVPGSGSLRVRSALRNKGFMGGVDQFLEECTLDAIRAMNRFGLSHPENIAPYAMLFLFASPLVGELITHTLTRDLGLSIANNVPVLAAGWATSSAAPETLDSFQKAERMADKYGITDFSASQARSENQATGGKNHLRTPAENLNIHREKHKE